MRVCFGIMLRDLVLGVEFDLCGFELCCGRCYGEESELGV